MNSGYGTLRAKLSSRLSYSLKEDDSKQFHQVSEISEADATEADQDTLDSSERSTAVIDLNKADSQYRWKNRFEGSLGETDRLKSRWEEPQLPASCFPRSLQEEEEEEEESNSTRFTGVFQATLVELDCDPAPLPSAPPASPDTESLSQFDMDNLVDTLKSMGPSFRPRTTGIRSPAPVLVSSLPPIVEDASSPATADVPASAAPTNKTEGNAGLYTLPVDLGLRSSRDTRSPLELMKENQLQVECLNSPLRTGINSSSLRKSSDSPFEDLQSQMLNGNGGSPSSSSSSRLGNSVIFGGHRSAAGDAASEKRPVHRSLFQTSSLPETGLRNNRASVGSKELETGPKKDPAGTRFERISFILNSTTSSLTGGEEPNICVSRPPQSSISPPASNSPSRLLSPTGSIDLHWPFATTDSPLSMFSQVQGMGMGVGFQSQECEPENNFSSKYRAFPDAYVNVLPGRNEPNSESRIEVRSDVVDATQWELQETISIRVVRGGWVLYEKRNFKGEKIALDEGDIELTCPFSPPEEQLQNGHQEGKEQNGEKSDAQTEVRPTRRFIIGSIRRAVRDYSVPEISLFPEENAEGKKVVFRDTSEDARIFGFPIKANSVIINAGLWLVYAHPFFQGIPRVLEVGGYINPAAWGVEKPYVGSLHPLKIGEPRVENMSEPQLVIYDRAYFTGKSRTIYSNMRDFMTRTDRQQSVFMYSVGSIKVVGGIWVGYEKEGFRGHQYLLEEGEYHDWRVWGGCNSELRSVRVIRADLTDPLMVMFEMPEEDQEGVQEGNTFEVTEAIPDVELFEYKTLTRSIHVLSGAWIAYSHVDFSGNQYILEKGFYNNCADWGSQDNRICSVQPILTVKTTVTRRTVILYSEPDFQGKCQVFDRNQESVSEKLLTKSCRVSGGSWVFYEEKQFSGNLYVLSEGDYPNLTSMGCTPTFTICSIKAVPMMFSVPSISLFGLECLEGREITTETEILSMVEEGFNNLILSIKVNSGCWVVCEHSNYRGRQFLLEPIEITNWLKFSSLQTVGSMFPVRQRRRFFRIKNKEQGHFMSVQGGVEEMKSGRVVVSPEAEPMSDVWFYQDGFIKNKLSQTMSLQVMGNIEPGTKVVLWTETREPVQSWTAQMTGLISSLTFPGMVLDVKGGKTYDKDHVVIMPENEERPSQQWEIELL
uniref:Beta/gamma crystallin 'Greek key' domain-containing protein n=1 Tax=Mola mola TaxID=94237 RepID=A0A3Q3WJA2_MOLML